MNFRSQSWGLTTQNAGNSILGVSIFKFSQERGGGGMPPVPLASFGLPAYLASSFQTLAFSSQTFWEGWPSGVGRKSKLLWLGEYLGELYVKCWQKVI